MTYAIKEAFYTLQGEGTEAGRAAVFVRFIGCNLWSGWEADRARDAKRSGAQCPLWCDTDFRALAPMVGAKLLASDVVALIADLCGLAEHPDRIAAPIRVVFTGGEPMLQLDQALLVEIRRAFPAFILTVETNGTVTPRPGVTDLLDVICVSPKLIDEKTLVRTGTELKVVVPAYQPADFAKLATGFSNVFVQAQADASDLISESHAVAVEHVLSNPRLRLSVQVHKVLGIR
jgi:organic radical activating enzyme